MNTLIVACIIGSVAPDITTGDFTVVLSTKVEILEYNSGGVPMVFATRDGIGANADFFLLPLWVQEFLIAHELGHIDLGHVYENPDLDRSVYYLIWKTVDPRERDADFFAANIVGVDMSIDAMLVVLEICKKVKATNCTIEAMLRSEMLRGQYCF